MTGQPWTRGLLASFDLETTGTDPFEARMVQASVMVIGANFGVVARRWLVNPGVEIPAEAAAIHGITTERARAEGQPAAAARQGPHGQHRAGVAGAGAGGGRQGRGR